VPQIHEYSGAVHNAAAVLQTCFAYHPSCVHCQTRGFSAMSKMPLAVLLLLTIIPVGVLHAAAPDPKVVAELKNLSHLLSDGIAELYKDKDTVVTEHLKATEHHDDGILALFTMESYQGGNNSYQFMAFYKVNDPKESPHSGKPFHKYSLMSLTQVGEGGDRFFDSIEVQGDTVVLKGQSWTDKDPSCCPTGKVQASFSFGPYGISEIKATQ
jgi:hypothetical protein